MTKKSDFAAAQKAIVNALSQHASYGYRASTSVVNAMNEKIDQFSRELTSKLTEQLEDLAPGEMEAFLAGKYTTSRLKALKAEIDGWAAALDQAISAEWAASSLSMAGYEFNYMKDLLSQAFDDVPKIKRTPKQVLQAAMEKPVTGKLVKDMLAKIVPDQKDRVLATMRQGIAAGQTTPEIVRALRGTKALQYRDGVVQAAKYDVERFVRTCRNHIANGAYDQTYEALGVSYVVRVASLEGRTCKACAALDGRVYKTDEPKPPATLHPNCRCQYAPSLDGELIGNRPYLRALKVKKRDGSDRFRSVADMTKKQREEAGLKVGQVNAGTSYGKWFSNQDAAYQKEWLGQARYKLYSEGKYGLDRFIDPKTGHQYNLDELRQRDTDTFKQIFGD